MELAAKPAPSQKFIYLNHCGSGDWHSDLVVFRLCILTLWFAFCVVAMAETRPVDLAPGASSGLAGCRLGMGFRGRLGNVLAPF